MYLVFATYLRTLKLPKQFYFIQILYSKFYLFIFFCMCLQFNLEVSLFVKEHFEFI